MTKQDEPVFEVRDGAKIYRIWVSGQVEGFGNDPVVVNRIPALIAEAVDEVDSDEGSIYLTHEERMEVQHEINERRRAAALTLAERLGQMPKRNSGL